MITESEDYFTRGCGRCARFDTEDCATRIWAEGLAALRGICRAADLEETAKWGHPCYTHKGRNVAIIGAFRADFRLTFFNAALLHDPHGVLERQGPNTQNPGMIRFVEASKVAELKPIIEEYLREARGHAEAGTKPTKTRAPLEIPIELQAALQADVTLADAFASLTPGRQRSYVLNLGSAKASKTRIARIAKFRDKFIAGKGATER